MDRAHETILVTGAAGFIGSHVVDRLLAGGATVLGVDNYDPFYSAELKCDNLASANRSDRFYSYTLDCGDLPALESALRHRRIDAIIHLAARAGVRPSLRDPVGYVQSNVVATQAVLELARRREVRRVLFASSSSVYGEADSVPFDEEMPTSLPVSPYAATKRAGELLCATHCHLNDAAIVALRFFTVFGPRQRPDLAIRKFASLMLEDRLLPFHGDGTTARDYTWIDDIVDGVIGALEFTGKHPSRFEVINLGGSRMTSLRRLVELLESALGRKARLDPQPAQPGDVSRTCASVAKAARLLGYAPRVSVEEGIPRFAEWLVGRRPRRQTLAGRHLSELVDVNLVERLAG